MGRPLSRADHPGQLGEAGRRIDAVHGRFDSFREQHVEVACGAQEIGNPAEFRQKPGIAGIFNDGTKQ